MVSSEKKNLLLNEIDKLNFFAAQIFYTSKIQSSFTTLNHFSSNRKKQTAQTFTKYIFTIRRRRTVFIFQSNTDV